MDTFVKYGACKSLSMHLANVGEQKDLLGREMMKMKNDQNEMSRCDMGILKNTVIHK